MHLKHLQYTTKPPDRFSCEALRSLQRSEFAVDTESYPNFWLFAVKDLRSKKVWTTASSPDETLDTDTILHILYHHTIITFNGNNYDMPLIWAACENGDPQILNELSTQIINEEGNFRNESKSIDHIDIMEVIKGKCSQKLYAGRLGSKRLQSLPYSPETSLSKDEAEYLTDYCLNDLDDLELLYTSIAPQIDLRKSMSKQYGMDLRSKSDAQIAEAVIISEITKDLGYTPRKPKVKSDLVLRYQAPEFLRQNVRMVRPALDLVETLEFFLDKNGSPKLPDVLTNYDIRIGKGLYKLRLGGLHSSEKSCYHVSDDNYVLRDHDVASFYPAIILNFGFFPKQFGETFLTTFEEIRARRIKAKHDKNKVVSDALKIVLNGTYGKLGSAHSKMYDPEKLISVTLTGQLSLLLLIEMLERKGIEVVSANTDGVVIKCLRSMETEATAVIKLWESFSGFETEETRYKAIYARDVNSYFAIKEDGSLKGKGQFARTVDCNLAEVLLDKNPKYDIAKQAVIELITNGTPLKVTIENCTDLSKFVSLVTVKGGAHKDGWFLGKSVRWYYAKGVWGSIKYINSGNAVPETEGAKPLMELPDVFPGDVDYARYIIEAERILHNIGMKQRSLFD